MSRPLALALALLFALSPLAQADLVHLSSGGVIKGDIIAETEEEVTIKTPAGVQRLIREDIVKIERGASPESVYKERLQKLAPNDADGFYRLGVEAKKMRLEKQARECFERTLKIEPNHLPAKIAIAEEKARAEALVVVVDDEKAAPEPQAPVSRGKLPQDILRALDDAKKLTKLDDPERRKSGWAMVREIGEGLLVSEAVPFGTDEEEMRAQATASVVSLADGHRKLYERNARRLAGAIPDWDRAEARKARDRYLEAWEKAKDDAMKVIFDLTIYPDENHGRVGQPKVDEKVDVVKKVYPPYEQLLLHDLSRFNAMSEEQARTFAAVLEKSRTCLGEALFEIEALAPGSPALKPLPQEPPAVHRALLLYRAGRIEDAYAVAEGGAKEGGTASGLARWELRLLERLRDIRVEAYNDRLLADKAPPKVGRRPTAEERKQVLITNNYRILMAREALEIHLCLIESARGHSEEMTKLGYFEHESPVEKNRTPSDRVKNAGYPSGAAENISLGSVSPQATHEAWYNSSGHHRNILGEGHKAMGSGLDGQHWTQNFGSHGELVR